MLNIHEFSFIQALLFHIHDKTHYIDNTAGSGTTVIHSHATLLFSPLCVYETIVCEILLAKKYLSPHDRIHRTQRFYCCWPGCLLSAVRIACCCACGCAKDRTRIISVSLSLSLSLSLIQCLRVLCSIVVPKIARTHTVHVRIAPNEQHNYHGQCCAENDPENTGGCAARLRQHVPGECDRPPQRPHNHHHHQHGHQRRAGYTLALYVPAPPPTNEGRRLRGGRGRDCALPAHNIRAVLCEASAAGGAHRFVYARVRKKWAKIVVQCVLCVM